MLVFLISLYFFNLLFHLYYFLFSYFLFILFIFLFFSFPSFLYFKWLYKNDIHLFIYYRRSIQFKPLFRCTLTSRSITVYRFRNESNNRIPTDVGENWHQLTLFFTHVRMMFESKSDNWFYSLLFFFLFWKCINSIFSSKFQVNMYSWYHNVITHLKNIFV